MLLKGDVQVLVAGAGPVGLYTALLLARGGVKVAVVDEQHRTAARTYACALHPRTLRLLDEVGLAAPLLAKGERADGLAFFAGAAPAAEVRYGELKSAHPYLLVVPQQTLEDALEERLKAEGVPVLWSHRLTDLRIDETMATARLQRLKKVGSGYSVQSSEWVVDADQETRVPFVIGADGHRSRVWRALGIDLETRGDAQLFAVFEFGAAAPPVAKVRVGLAGGKASVLWPLGQGWWRFGFEIAEEPGEARREKSRALALAGDPSFLDLDSGRFEGLVAERAPWFGEEPEEFAWSMAIRFERRLAQSFGRGPAWILGDAAHLAPPIAVHSMNAGFFEAQTLATELTAVLRAGAPREKLDLWARARHAEFDSLLTGVPVARAEAGAFARENARLVGDCLPASGDDRALLLAQLGLALP